MNPTELSFSSKQLATIAGRVLCVVTLMYAALHFIDLPEHVFALLRYRGHTDPAGSDYYSYWSRRYAEYALGDLFKGTAELWLAGVFYRMGPRVTRFLLGEDGRGAVADRREGAEG